MRSGLSKVVGLACLFILVTVAVASYFRQHNHQLMSVSLGSMSAETKQHFWKLGINCEQTYQVQGYESPETIQKMFSLSHLQFSHLNPGVGMELHANDYLCVRGLYDVAAGTLYGPAHYLWPALCAGMGVVGAVAAIWTRKQLASSATVHAAGKPNSAI